MGLNNRRIRSGIPGSTSILSYLQFRRRIRITSTKYADYYLRYKNLKIVHLYAFVNKSPSLVHIQTQTVLECTLLFQNAEPVKYASKRWNLLSPLTRPLLVVPFQPATHALCLLLTINYCTLQLFPEKKFRGLRPNFHIHVSASHLYISRIGPHILLQQNRQTDRGNIPHPSQCLVSVFGGLATWGKPEPARITCQTQAPRTGAKIRGEGGVICGLIYLMNGWKEIRPIQNEGSQ